MVDWSRSSLRIVVTFGLALIIQGVFQNYFGSSGFPMLFPYAEGWRQPRLYVSADLSWLGCHFLARGLSAHLVFDQQTRLAHTFVQPLKIRHWCVHLASMSRA